MQAQGSILGVLSGPLEVMLINARVERGLEAFAVEWFQARENLFGVKSLAMKWAWWNWCCTLS